MWVVPCIALHCIAFFLVSKTCLVSCPIERHMARKAEEHQNRRTRHRSALPLWCTWALLPRTFTYGRNISPRPTKGSQTADHPFLLHRHRPRDDPNGSAAHFTILRRRRGGPRPYRLARWKDWEPYACGPGHAPARRRGAHALRRRLLQRCRRHGLPRRARLPRRRAPAAGGAGARLRSAGP